MTFAKPVEQAEANAMIDTCLEHGINFIDTANMYQAGASETMLGNALRGRREQVVLASKVRAKMPEGEEGLSRAAIVQAVENSLRRLQTDYLDLYFLHQPDYAVPVEESLAAMDQLVSQGKVRFPGTSNYASWQVAQMLAVAKDNGYVPAATAQPMYSLLARGIEQEFIPMARTLDVSLVVYNPLAAGLLTGKHQAEAIPQGGRFDKNPMYQDRYWHAQTFEAVAALKQVADDAGRSLISLAFAWLLHHTATDCVILGASRLEQLLQNIVLASDGPLSSDSVAACDRVWQQLRGPLPVYNR